MSTVAEIESAIEKLSSEEQRKLAKWYAERQALLNAADTLFQQYDDEERASLTGRSAEKSGWLIWGRAGPLGPPRTPQRLSLPRAGGVSASLNDAPPRAQTSSLARRASFPDDG